MPAIAVGISPAFGGLKWTPRKISGLVYWLDANDLSTLFQNSTLTTPVTADSDPVGGWKDKTSGSTSNVYNSTADRYPLYKTNIQNGKPGVLFDGSNDRMAFNGLPELDGTATVIVVCKTVDNNAFTYLLHLCRNTGNVYNIYLTVNTSANVCNAAVFD